jgi:hypothetical protein
MSRTKTGFALFAPVVVTVGVVIGLAAASKARAGDYQVAYAIDAGGVREPGKYVECIYRTACRLDFERTSIHMLVIADGGQKRSFVLVNIYDGRNCCYFYDGGNWISLNGDKRYHQLPIFEGRKRVGNEFVLNRKIGNIFLSFEGFR